MSPPNYRSSAATELFNREISLYNYIHDPHNPAHTNHGLRIIIIMIHGIFIAFCSIYCPITHKNPYTTSHNVSASKGVCCIKRKSNRYNSTSRLFASEYDK